MSGYKLQYNCITVTQFSHLCVCVGGGCYQWVFSSLFFSFVCSFVCVHKRTQKPCHSSCTLSLCTAQIKSLCSLFLQTIPLSSVASSSFFH